MEPFRMKHLFLSLLLLYSYQYSIAENAQVVRAPVWVYLESVPGTSTNEARQTKIPPIQELDEISRFILGGMIYGWTFSYTPSDILRNVKEYFSMQPVQVIAHNDPRVFLSNIKPDYPHLSCWAEFTIDETLALWTSRWSSIMFKSGKGRGKADRSEEMQGIKKAYSQAVLQAVREHARKLVKNKPKEIKGEVLLRDNPRLLVDEGSFIVDIRVLISIKELVPYQTF